MKVRLAYVSNSSSSSFCLMGIKIPCNYSELWDRFYTDRRTLGLRLELESGMDDLGEDSCVIGFSPEKMRPEETLTEFKERILSEILLLPEDLRDQLGLPEDMTVDKLKWIKDQGHD